MTARSSDRFPTLRTEGAILPVDLLQRIAAGNNGLNGLTPASYHLIEGEKLNEATNRAWNRLLGVWGTFRNAAEKLPPANLGTSITLDRWLLPLWQELGYGRLLPAQPVELEEKTYPVSHFWLHTPIHMVGCRADLDRRTTRTEGGSSPSPHSLVQELINRSEEYLWAFVTNGLRLRILRDSSRLTRQAYVEFDLQAMFEGKVYTDFALLWRLCHQSRVEAEKPHDCWLEQWSKAAQQQGLRVLDQLRGGVERAISALGRGFLSCPANQALREKLRVGRLDAQDYYRQLLRMVYRLLFLFAAEDRELLFDPQADQVSRDRYARFYSTARLREQAERLRGTQHTDLWEMFALVMDRLGSVSGCPELGLPALGGFLFSSAAVPNLSGCRIANANLLDAVRALAVTSDGHALRPVDYRNLGAEELGSVYESLLELHPVLNAEAGTFELATASSHERKTTGSYYTPTSLITCLLDSALDPVLDEALQKPDPEKVIRNLKVCDPACGSGHFLIAAAHRIAKRLAFVRTGEEEPPPEAIRTALRDVIGHSIYGVDINPMAVELCKVALWMEALEPGKPLSFLDHHIQCGNSLLGATPALLAQGVSDAAFQPIEGDVKARCTELKKQNKREREEYAGGQMYLFDTFSMLGNLPAEFGRLNAAPDSSLDQVAAIQDRYAELVHGTSYRNAGLWADTWCAAFVWKKDKTELGGFCPTERDFRNVERSAQSGLLPHVRAEVERLCDQYQFFHWHLAFPDVFHSPGKGERPDNEQTGWCGGFDVVLGNPPWERIKLQEQEWFAECRPDIAEARNAAARRRMIAALAQQDPALYSVFLDDCRRAEGHSHIIRNSGAFPLCGRGDVNTYTLFVELAANLRVERGRVGQIVPSGIATDSTTSRFFESILEDKRLVSFFDFENREGFFPRVGHGRMKFALITLGCAETAKAAFQLLRVEECFDKSRLFDLSFDLVKLLNPNTRTCPIFASRRDSVINQAVYTKVGVLVRDASPPCNPWHINFFSMLHMANDSGLFETEEGLQSGVQEKPGFVIRCNGKRFLPLYEAKMASFYDHRFGTYEGRAVDREATMLDTPPVAAHADPWFAVKPRYWVDTDNIRFDGQWVLGFRDITHSTNDRTCIAHALPESGVGHSVTCVRFDARDLPVPCFLGNVSSFVFDYFARQKVGGLHLSVFICKQLPVLNPERYYSPAEWCPSERLASWIGNRVMELTYTAWDLKHFAEACGYTGPPYRWDEERRFHMRSELDAAFFHLYGISKDDAAYIMDTFPIVRRKDEELHGVYRTKETILTIYDVLAEAVRSGRPYETRLDVPPGRSERSPQHSRHRGANGT